MVTTCAVCIAIGRNLTATLLPTTVTYRGYSLCIEHLHLWEDNRDAEWAELIELTKEPSELEKVWEAAPDNTETIRLYEDRAVAVLPGGEEVEVLQVDLSDIKTDEEKHDALLKAVDDFNHGVKKISVTEMKEILTVNATDIQLESEMDAAERASVEATEADGTAPWIEPKKPAKRGRPKGKGKKSKKKVK